MNHDKLNDLIRNAAGDSEEAADARYEAEASKIQTFRLSNGGIDPATLVLQAVPGQGPKYRELHVSVYDHKTKCLADLVIGVDSAGNLRIATTSNGEGDGEKNIAVFPLRQKSQAVETL